MTLSAVVSRPDAPTKIKLQGAPRSALAHPKHPRTDDPVVAFERPRQARRVRFAEEFSSRAPLPSRLPTLMYRHKGFEAAPKRPQYEFIRVKPHPCVSRPMALVGCLAGLVMGYGLGLSRMGMLTTGMGVAAAGTWASVLLVMLATLPSYHRGRRLQPQ